MTRSGGGLPYRRFTITILVRASVIWLAVRAAMPMAMAMAGGAATGNDNAGITSAGVVALVTVLVRLDLARLNERLFLANLGVRTGVLTALAALPPLVLEAAYTVGPAAELTRAIGSLWP